MQFLLEIEYNIALQNNSSCFKVKFYKMAGLELRSILSKELRALSNKPYSRAN